MAKGYIVVLSRTEELETFYDLASNLAADLENGIIDQEKLPDSRSRMDTVIEWTNEFNRLHTATEWGMKLDYIETVDEFYADKTRDMRSPE